MPLITDKADFVFSAQGRAGTPDEAAGGVYLFCSPDSNYVSGQTLVVGGGFAL